MHTCSGESREQVSLISLKTRSFENIYSPFLIINKGGLKEKCRAKSFSSSLCLSKLVRCETKAEAIPPALLFNLYFV